MEKLTTIDLFCGAGGFSLGMEKAGFRTIAALDANPEALIVFKKNFPDVKHVLEKDLTKFGPADLEKVILVSHVDVIIGGPPCQGFSNARRVDGSNNGPKVVPDSRRYLYQEFIKFVGHFKPKVFVMENVLGIKTAGGGEYFLRVQEEARALGYRVHGQVVKAVDYGVPQKRVRQLIIGTRLDIPLHFRNSFMPATHADNPVSLGEAIDDLPIVRAGGGAQVMEYNHVRHLSHTRKYGGDFLSKVIEVDRAKPLTAHMARPRSERDLRDFARLREGENSKTAQERGVKFEFPYDRTVFCDRYTRQHRARPCSTIVAHLSKDGLMFIHPTQTRTLTPREVARAQTFPDWFEFPVDRTHQYRVIGNAVPPLVGNAVGKAIRRYLALAQRPRVGTKQVSESEAATHVLELLKSRQDTKTLTRDQLLLKLVAVGTLFPQLHPLGGLENGTRTEEFPHVPRLGDIGPRYRQSGWPLSLVPLVHEAWRRNRVGELREEEIFDAWA